MTSAVDTLSLFVPDLVGYTMTNFIPIPDVYSAACVCKLWNGCVEKKGFWEGVFDSRGVPRVSNETGPRDYRSDLRVLFPVTLVSGEIFRKIFGEPVGKDGVPIKDLPFLSVKIFNMLSEKDPFTPEIAQKRSFQLIVEYPFFARILGTKETPFYLDDNGNLQKLSDDFFDAETKELFSDFFDEEFTRPTVIPFTLRNRMTLLDYPIVGKKGDHLIEHSPDDMYDDMMKQCDYCPEKVNLYYQRREVPSWTAGLRYDYQMENVEEKGFQMMPFGVRLLSNGVEMMTLGTCPDNCSLTALTSTTVMSGAFMLYPYMVQAESELTISRSRCCGQVGNASMGAAVGIPAEEGS